MCIVCIIFLESALPPTFCMLIQLPPAPLRCMWKTGVQVVTQRSDILTAVFHFLSLVPPGKCEYCLILVSCLHLLQFIIHWLSCWLVLCSCTVDSRVKCVHVAVVVQVKCTCCHISRNCRVSSGSIVNIVTRLWAGWSGVRTPAMARDFSSHSARTFSGIDAGSYPVVTGALFPKVLHSLSTRLTTHIYLLSWPRMNGIYTFTPLIHLQCGHGFIFCCEVGRWRELIVAAAAGSRCIWNVTAFRMLWMFYESTKDWRTCITAFHC